MSDTNPLINPCPKINCQKKKTEEEKQILKQKNLQNATRYYYKKNGIDQLKERIRKCINLRIFTAKNLIDWLETIEVQEYHSQE